MPKRTVAVAYAGGGRKPPKSRATRQRVPLPTLPIDVWQCVAEQADASVYRALSSTCRALRDRLLFTRDVIDRALDRYARTTINDRTYWGGGKYHVTKLPGGQMHGVECVVDNDGKMVWRTHYRKGEIHGLVERWEPISGLLLHRLEYVNGCVMGTDEYWHPNGVRSRLSFWFKGKKYHGEHEWNDQGVLTRLTFWQRGRQICVKDYDHTTGVLFHVLRFRRGVKHGAEQWWLNGELLTTHHWVRGHRAEIVQHHR